MKYLLILMGCVLLGGCTELSLNRERGETKDGYTTYRTTLHAVAVDEPICHGSCKP